MSGEPSSLFDLADLRRYAEGEPITRNWQDGTETWYCGERDGEYVGWIPRETAEAKGYEPDRTKPLPPLLALIEAVEAAREVVWRKEPDGSITVVSGLKRLESKLWAFK